MKKTILLLLTAMIVFSCQHGLTEDFVLRNGILFGDSMEDVLSKETFTIDKIVDTVEEDNNSQYPYTITTKKGTLAGINDSTITYKFNREKQLREVVYSFRSSSYKDFIDSDYNSVNSGLIRKYGKPLGYSNGDCYVFTGSALENAALVAYLYDMMGKYGDLRDYDEWDVELDDYHVKIEQVEYYCGLKYSELSYSHSMSYTYFTDEDLENELNEKQEEKDTVDNDI